MRVGTKSVLFGAHCFLIHPWFVAAACTKLYGFPWDPRLWVAFGVHDLGYFGKPNMDGEEGERHWHFGAQICWMLFDDFILGTWFARTIGRLLDRVFGKLKAPDYNWYSFIMYHSRFISKKYSVRPSRLCMADKLAIALTPAWIYLPMATWSGEIYEYMKLAQGDSTKYTHMRIDVKDKRAWYTGVRGWC